MRGVVWGFGLGTTKDCPLTQVRQVIHVAGLATPSSGLGRTYSILVVPKRRYVPDYGGLRLHAYPCPVEPGLWGLLRRHNAFPSKKKKKKEDGQMVCPDTAQ